MTREIKFRAWDKTEESMIQEYTKFYENGELYFAYVALPKDLIVMQYTGLHDKNGKEVYEGDIVKTHPGTDKRIKFLDTIEKVEFKDGSFIVQGITIPRQWNKLSKETDRIEVIGNLYENPELLHSDK